MNERPNVGSTATMLHGWHHDDYDQAKNQIMESLGSTADLEIFGSTVLVAMYVRPNINPKTGLIMGTRKQTEDVYNGKAVLILKCGPDAFRGTEGWLKQRFGEAAPPAPGDWCFILDGSVGDPQWFCGDGAKRPKAVDARGDPMDVYEWDGWPCRAMDHMSFWARMNKPHQLV